MRPEAELQRRLHALTELEGAVGAMRSLSAHHFRRTREAVASVRTYREGVERIASWTRAEMPAGPGAAGLVVVGGELGLCGSYNVRVVEAAVRARAELGPGPTFCVGHRAGVLLARRVPNLRRTYAGPTSIRGLTELLLRLAEEVLEDYVSERLSKLEIIALSYRGVGVDVEQRLRVLPFSAEPRDRPLPLRYAEQEVFAAAGTRERLYVTLYGVLLDALAAEQGARLVATQAAEKWLHERREELRRRLSTARREAGTQEVIEIATGARWARARARK